MLFIGSVALSQYLDIKRNPRDIDIMGSYDECMAYIKSLPGKMKKCYPTNEAKKIIAFKGDHIVEAEITWEGSTAEMFVNLMNSMGFYKYASLDGLYALKMSHRYLRNSPAFLKTMRDIKLLRENGASITPELQEFFDRREQETYDYGHPKLNVSKKEFFTDQVPYQYDHDTIHVTQKHLDEPAYRYFIVPGEEVKCSRELFEKLPLKVRLYATLEEAYVLALERSQIPYADRATPKESFDLALKKLCSSITSGWFREFSWEHYDMVQELYDDVYVDRFKAGLDAGIVKPFEG